VNGTEPESRGLPESDIADMERVLDEIELLPPILGFDVLTPPLQDTKLRESPLPGVTIDSPLSPPVFIMDVQKAKGRAMERSGEFVVLAGSTALRRETPGISQSTMERRKVLVEAGVLIPDTDPDLYRFSQDASFGSASGASTVIAGRSDNGRTSWHMEGRGVSYGNWRTEQISGDPVSG